MDCKNHIRREAIGSCVNCGNLFCSDCLIKVKNKNYCKECATDIIGEKTGIGTRNIVISQQQQQQTDSSNNGNARKYDWKGFGSTNNLIKWLISLTILTMAFFALRTKSYLAFIIFIILGAYWFPPILDKITQILKEKYNIIIPKWLRIFGSIILFLIAITFFNIYNGGTI